MDGDYSTIADRRNDTDEKRMRILSSMFMLLLVSAAQDALTDERPPELTPAGKAIVQRMIASAGEASVDRFAARKPQPFPLPTCMFAGGLCGAVRHDGTIAVRPRYDWVGGFFDNRAAVRVGGLYGFVDEDGREIVTPQHRMVDDYKFGFAQVDVNGKSGLIDREGRMVIAPKYGSIVAIGPDRFRVSDHREPGGADGGEDFSRFRVRFLPDGGISISDLSLFAGPPDGVIDLSGQWIEPPAGSQSRTFGEDDPSIRWVRKDKLWGLARADGSWIIEPQFQQAGALSDGLARVVVDGRVSFIDRTAKFVIAPTFDQADAFAPEVGRAAAKRGGITGVIDKSGAWVFQTNYQRVHLAAAYHGGRRTVFGWGFENAGRWGLLDLNGHIILDAAFDQSLQRCEDGRLEGYKNKEFYYFDSNGRPLQPPDGRLVNAACGSEPPFVLKVGDRYGLVDAAGQLVTPLHFEALTWAGRGVNNAKLDGKWGRIGTDGRWMLEPRFDYLSSGLDIFVASVDGKRGIMRADGTWAVEPRFDAAALRGDGTALVTVAGATGVLLLANESWIVPPRPGMLCDIRHALIWQHDGVRTVLSPTGETWIDLGAERVGINLDPGLIPFLKGGKWGLADTAGEVIAEPQFDDPVFFTPAFRGIAWAKRGNHWCAMDRRAHPIPDIPCADVNPAGSSFRFACKVEP